VSKQSHNQHGRCPSQEDQGPPENSYKRLFSLA
jgi:hypothetical protein